MAVIEGISAGVLAEVDPDHDAIRTSLRPNKALGFYSLAAFSGALAGAGANTPVFSLRWTSATALCLVYKITLKWVTTTAFTTPQQLNHALVFARGFTVSDSGQTAIVVTGGLNRRRTSYPSSQMGDLRISAAGAITAGTRTLDANALATAQGWSGAQGAALQETELWLAQEASDAPLVLAQNEGLVITNITAMGAAGVISLGVEIDWAEVTATDWAF